MAGLPPCLPRPRLPAVVPAPSRRWLHPNRNAKGRREAPGTDTDFHPAAAARNKAAHSLQLSQVEVAMFLEPGVVFGDVLIERIRFDHGGSRLPHGQHGSHQVQDFLKSNP